MAQQPEIDKAIDQSNTELIARVASDLERHLAAGLPSGLYLVSTPIGNLADITLRALSVLAQADVIYCEDTRHSARLLQHYAIRARTRPLHDHNEERELDRIIADLRSGQRIAIISDAGTPLVSDPGFKLVRAAAQEGLAIVVIPGASAALAALVASGLPTDAFYFAGFLPAKQAARRSRLTELSAIQSTIVFFEAPHRTAETLSDIASLLGNREASVARELTKLHEEIARGPASALSAQFPEESTKGEIVIVVGPPAAVTATDEEISARLAQVQGRISLKDAAKALAEELGVPKSRIYALGLKAKDGAQ